MCVCMHVCLQWTSDAVSLKSVKFCNKSVITVDAFTYSKLGQSVTVFHWQSTICAADAFISYWFTMWHASAPRRQHLGEWWPINIVICSLLKVQFGCTMRHVNRKTTWADLKKVGADSIDEVIVRELVENGKMTRLDKLGELFTKELESLPMNPRTAMRLRTPV